MRAQKHQIDLTLTLAIGALLLIGLVMLSSAGAVIAYERFSDSYFFLKRQIIFGVIPGLALAFIFSRIPYYTLRRFAFPMLLVSIGLLITVFIPGLGASYNTGSRSWITLGGFSLQPSEIVKLTFLIYLAAWLEQRGERGIKHFSYGFVPFVSLLGLIMFLMVLQPDVGTMMIIVMIAMAVYFVAGARLKHMGVLALGGAGLLALLIKIAPYRLARFTIFLNPELDPQGIGYHINQAFLAIGSGGWFGRGLGQSRQKFHYLPEVTGDSIFAIMAEEVGFLVVCIFLALLFFIAYRGLRIAASAPDRFSKLLAVGITCWIMIQSFVNIGAMVGLMPLTGVPLPLVSYGGTAMMINLASLGILLNISKYTRG